MTCVNSLLQTEDFPYACRCCLFIKSDMTPIHGALIPVMFERCLNLELDNPIFPMHICRQCLMQLNRFYTFLNQCNRAESVLHKIVGIETQIKIETDNNLNETEIFVPEVLIEDNDEKNEKTEEPQDIKLFENEPKEPSQIFEQNEPKIIEKPKSEEINILTTPITYSTVHHNVPEVLICHMCSELFKNLTQIREHVKNVHKNVERYRPLSIYYCLYCKRMYASKSAKIEHEKNCKIIVKPKKISSIKTKITPKQEVRKKERTFKRITRSTKKIKYKI